MFVGFLAFISLLREKFYFKLYWDSKSRVICQQLSSTLKIDSKQLKFSFYLIPLKNHLKIVKSAAFYFQMEHTF